MTIKEDLWLSVFFGQQVFKIDIADSGNGCLGEFSNISETIARHAGQNSPATYYTKIDPTQVELIRRLNTAGFYVVDVNVTFGIDVHASSKSSKPSYSKFSNPSSLSIDQIDSDHHRDVLEIAGSCFQYSRFHLDPFVLDGIANRIKAGWILSYLRKERGDAIFVARIDQRPVGFLAVLLADLSGKRVGIIDLLGVSRAFQQQGIGQALTTYFIDQYKDRCDRLQAGTQVANLASMRLYEKVGFRIINTKYVMHMHTLS